MDATVNQETSELKGPLVPPPAKGEEEATLKRDRAVEEDKENRKLPQEVKRRRKECKSE